MKTRQLPSPALETGNFPRADEIAVLRAWYEGVEIRSAVVRYMPSSLGGGASARGVLGCIRRNLIAIARAAHRDDLAELLSHPARERTKLAKTVFQAVDVLRTVKSPEPLIADEIAQWFSPRAVRVLHAQGINTLADLTVRIPRRRQWWKAIPGLGRAIARDIETFFFMWPALTEKARALIAMNPQREIVPWESIKVPQEVDGSAGTFRAPVETCNLDATNDYEAVQTWLSLHESPDTRRTYRKEAERLILWAIFERGRALSSLTTEDAIAYRAFLRHPSRRWVGPVRARLSPDWRPFNGSLSARSVAHALSIVGALFRWLIEHRYVLANPFSGVKVRDAGGAILDTSHAFTEGEWALTRTLADGLEWSCKWEAAAAQRVRFLLDFGYATGLRASELVGATLGRIETDPHNDHWIRVTGKGRKTALVALPPLGWNALARYLAERGLPVTQQQWNPNTPIIGNLETANSGEITSTRLRMIMRRFFLVAADVIESDHPALAEKLRRASPHWMRHTHATHALGRGAELTVVRDNLRHASVSTTSIYLHADETKRARQLTSAFSGKG